jgi:hypothetical protein
MEKKIIHVFSSKFGKEEKLCRILGSHSDSYECCHLLGLRHGFHM